MKLQDLAAKPQLVEVTIDDADIVEEMGEPITFWTWDRQPMATFIKLASVDSSNYASVMEAIKDLVLDETGKPIIRDDSMLPAKVMMRCITRLVEGLGKF